MHAPKRLILGLVLCLMPLSTLGQNITPVDYFKRKVIISPKPFPKAFKSDLEMITYLKSVHTNDIKLDKASGTWKFYFLAFFAYPLPKSIELRFYDVDGQKLKYLTGNTYDIMAENQRTMAGEYILYASDFKANKEYRMVFVKFNKVIIASTYIRLVK